MRSKATIIGTGGIEDGTATLKARAVSSAILPLFQPKDLRAGGNGSSAAHYQRLPVGNCVPSAPLIRLVDLDQGRQISAMESAKSNSEEDVQRAREAITSRFLRGDALEVGAGSRPFPLPVPVRICYGDIRDRESLESFFKNSDIQSGVEIDAQTFAGSDAGSFDFVISAHVIEHLRYPVGSIVHAIRVLKPGGALVLVVPDLRYTFDHNRPETTVEHALKDHQDGGESTTRQAYEEHLRYVHPYLTGEHYPEDEIQRQATESVKRRRELDIHFHAWTRDGFEMLLSAVGELAPFNIKVAEAAVNENIFVLRKHLDVSQNRN